MIHNLFHLGVTISGLPFVAVHAVYCTKSCERRQFQPVACLSGPVTSEELHPSGWEWRAQWEEEAVEALSILVHFSRMSPP